MSFIRKDSDSEKIETKVEEMKATASGSAMSSDTARKLKYLSLLHAIIVIRNVVKNGLVLILRFGTVVSYF